MLCNFRWLDFITNKETLRQIETNAHSFGLHNLETNLDFSFKKGSVMQRDRLYIILTSQSNQTLT